MRPTARRGACCSTWFGRSAWVGAARTYPSPRLRPRQTCTGREGLAGGGSRAVKQLFSFPQLRTEEGRSCVSIALHTHLAHSRLPQTSPVQEAGNVYVTGIGGQTSSPSIRFPIPFHECETCGRATPLAECPQCNVAFCHACLVRGHRCMCGSPRQTHTSQLASLLVGFIALYIDLSCLAARIAQVHSESPQTPLAQKPMSLSILT